MNIDNVSAPASHGTTSIRWADIPSIVPKTVTKDYLIAMKDRITRTGGQVPDGLDKLITNFNQATHQEGKMTLEQFTAYAAANGVDLPNPGDHPHRPQQTSGGHGSSGSQGPPAAHRVPSAELTKSTTAIITPVVSASAVAIQTTVAQAPLAQSQPALVATAIETPLDAYA
jgi:hypothetical protein